MSGKSRQTLTEEIANSISHGIGTLLAISGLAVLVSLAAIHGTARHIISCGIFGAALVLCYLTSTLYHGIVLPKVKRRLRVLDHTAIYLLIAGTYTPFMLVSLRGPWGWSLFGLVWGLALVGITLKLTIFNKLGRLSIVLYLLMGWIVVLAFKPLLTALEPGGIYLLLGGGLTYSGGVIFYRWKKLPYHHMIWHLFVMLGSFLHFLAVLYYVIPTGV